MRLIWETVKVVIMVKVFKGLFKCAGLGLAVIALALFLTGCGAGGPDEAKQIPGAYGVDPRGVSTDGIRASDTALVVAPCQGQAFQIPEQAFAFAKAAIEGEGYASVVSADTAKVTGKVYALTKNSQSGRKKESEGNELEYFGFAYSVRATQEGVRLLESMNAAADDLRARAQGANKVICVVASGVSGGILETSADLLAMPPANVVAQLRSFGAIGDYSGMDVRFYGLGQSTGNQVIPASAAGKIQSLMRAIVESGGGRAISCSDRLAPLGCDSQLPRVPEVAFGEDVLSIPALAAGQSAVLDLTETVLTFKGDSAEFANEAKARQVLGQVAMTLRQHAYRVSVVGHTANTGNGGGEELSLARAQKVAGTLAELGVGKGQIIQVTGVGSRDSTSYHDGAFDEAQARLDRKVCLVVSA